ncbi:MAG: AgmX/PglI C-terminal domain-containing protein [Polyangiaceae bacterium]
MVLTLTLAALGLAGCATAGSAGGAAPPAPTSDPGTSPDGSSGNVASTVAKPPLPECEPFMDVIARTTTLRAAIHREAKPDRKAAGWAAEAEQLAADTKPSLSNPDLIIESASLATRMGDLASDLRSLDAAMKATDPSLRVKAHKRVLETSEQVEVLTREPAARCGGDTHKLLATSGRLPASAVQQKIRERFPLAVKCYEDGLKRDRELEGRVTVRLVIGLDGKVSDARVATPEDAKTADILTPGDAPAKTMPDPKVTACVVDVLRGTVFPPPDGGTVSVVYPVTFSRAP